MHMCVQQLWGRGAWGEECWEGGCWARKRSLSGICPSEEEDEFLLTVFLLICSKAISAIQWQRSVTTDCHSGSTLLDAWKHALKMAHPSAFTYFILWQRKVLINYANVHAGIQVLNCFCQEDVRQLLGFNRAWKWTIWDSSPICVLKFS